jgi:DNA-binding CsgD family transcriptional regulator
MVKRDFVRVIENAYASAPDCESWFCGIADVVRPCCDQGLGAQVYAYDMRRPGEFRVSACATTGNSPVDGPTIEAITRTFPPQVAHAYHAPGGTHSVRELVPRVTRETSIRLAPVLGETFSRHGIHDVLGVGAGDPAGVGCIITFPSPQPIRLSPRLRRTLSHVGAHVAAGFRLHYAPGAAPGSLERTEPEAADAVLGPDGDLLHAAGPEATTARSALSRFVERRALARGRLRRESPAQAVELWKALLQGEWSVVDHVDTDGKRLLLARRNRPAVGDPGALTLRERQIVAYAALGHSIKFIGYELGLSPSTVSAHLKSALRKLRLRDRSELSRVVGSTAKRSND